MSAPVPPLAAAGQAELPRQGGPELGRRRRLLVLAICCASVIVVVMDISIVNVALPAIRRDLPVGAVVLVLSPRTGRLVGTRGPRRPLVVSGAALALGGGASIWLGPATPLPAVLGVYLLFGIFLGTVNPPITNTAVSGMPRSMAGVATALASAGRQTGTTLGVAISGTIVGATLVRGGTAFTAAERGVWWLVAGLGVGLLALGLLSTGRWAMATAGRAAALFEEVDRGADHRTGPVRSA
jgi:MFS family permease